jgi:hypothetical protein
MGSAGDVTMPAWGWLMMGLGIFFTVIVGGSLMVLIFYSSRAGYDEAPQIEYDAAPEDASDSAPATRQTGKRAGKRRKPKAPTDRHEAKRQRDKVTHIHT